MAAENALPSRIRMNAKRDIIRLGVQGARLKRVGFDEAVERYLSRKKEDGRKAVSNYTWAADWFKYSSIAARSGPMLHFSSMDAGIAWHF